MSTGSSLIFLAVCAAIGYGVYQIHRRKKWTKFFIVIGALILLGLVLYAGIFAYLVYANRPQVITKLNKVSLGMSPVDVTLLLGKPDQDFTDSTGQRRFVYEGFGKTEYIVRFNDRNLVGLVCTENSYIEIFGLRIYNSEEDVVKKLGEPSDTSINKDGLVKFISYGKYNASFAISKGSVSALCVTESGKVTFTEEYKE